MQIGIRTGIRIPDSNLPIHSVYLAAHSVKVSHLSVIAFCQSPKLKLKPKLTLKNLTRENARVYGLDF